MKVIEFSSAVLLTNAFILGFRHGIDWDHLAAIGDIVGVTSMDSSGAQDHCSTGVIKGMWTGDLTLRNLTLRNQRSLGLTLLYAVGHSIVVIVLSLIALSIAAEIPDSIKHALEIVVGVTLLVFGIGVGFSVVRMWRAVEPIAIASRWMYLHALLTVCSKWCKRHLLGIKSEHPKSITRVGYDGKAALGLGMLHGLGAETTTQLLIIGAVGGTTSLEAALALLLVFVMGFIISNTAVAVLFSGGFMTVINIRPVYIAAGTLAACFSILVGCLYIAGQAEHLPQLQSLWGGL